MLQTPTLRDGIVPSALEVDFLRRRDGLDLEDVLRRMGQSLGDLGADGLRSLAQQIDALSTSDGLGRVLARFAGTTAPPGNVVVDEQVGIVPIATTGFGIDFQLAEHAPSIHYAMAYSQLSSGSTIGMEHQIVNRTLTSFRVVFRTSGGGLSDPTISAWSFAFVLFGGAP